MLEIRDLTKTYGRRKAVDRLTLHARAGEVLALLGPNGAGKTTAIRCVVGLARPSGGEIVVAGHDAARDPLAARAATGYVPDRAWFYPKLTAREVLRYVAGVRRSRDAAARIEALLERFRLAAHADTLTEAYSHGMRQRLAFCVALLGDPRLFIADEPMVGLDVQGHRDVKRLLRELAAACSALAMTGLAVGLGAAHPRFDHSHPNELALTPGAVAYMALAVAYSASTAYLLARPALRAVTAAAAPAYWRTVEGAAALGGVAALSAAAAALALAYGVRQLSGREGAW